MNGAKRRLSKMLRDNRRERQRERGMERRTSRIEQKTNGRKGKGRVSY